MLVYQNKGMAAILVYKANLLGIELYFYANTFFCFIEPIWPLVTWVKTIYIKSNLVPRGCDPFGQHQRYEPLVESKKDLLWLAGKNKAKTWPEVVFDSCERSETKENYCCCCNNAVDNHRVYFYGEKAKSDGILMALEELTEVDFTPTNVQGICAVSV